ncbi:hypothetical protein HPB49_002927 [Dermacentor silvarum]|uniref:Uncharacterized protein n=1 Tax=Dermacentor silvarum TaxID=543639 RepID=A0ACB8CP15_DERSI|nr:hypothetical protein HPB49_002927 [Dermacentor silvarum]
MPDDHFRWHFPLAKETVRLLCEELAGKLEAERATGLSVERKVLCALRFFATGSKRPLGARRRSGVAVARERVRATRGRGCRKIRGPQQV